MFFSVPTATGQPPSKSNVQQPIKAINQQAPPTQATNTQAPPMLAVSHHAPATSTQDDEFADFQAFDTAKASGIFIKCILQNMQ